MKDRDIRIDISKGIGIILVVVGHCTIIPCEIVYQIISSFHMPLFFIWGGRFYKRKSIKDGLRSDFIRLIIPYIFVMSIYVTKFAIPAVLKGDYRQIEQLLLASIYSSACGHHSYFLSNVPSIHIMWFLPAMFMCRTFYNVISNLISSNLKYAFSLFISMMCAALDYYIINLPWGVLTGGAAMVFFTFGDYLKNKRIPLYVVIVLITSWFFSISFAHIGMSSGIYKIYPLAVLGACGGTAFVYGVSSLIKEYTKKIALILKWIGKYSMVIFCMHFIAVVVDLNTRLSVDYWFYWLLIDTIVIGLLTYVCISLPFTRKIFMLK